MFRAVTLVKNKFIDSHLTNAVGSLANSSN